MDRVGVVLYEVGCDLDLALAVFQTLGDIRHYDKLPATTRSYIARIEELTGVEVVLVSIGADRERTILRRNPFERR